MNSQLRNPSILGRQWKALGVLILIAISAALFSTSVLAQQSGEISGRITNVTDGSAIAGVGVEARSSNLPGVRTSTSSVNGDYRLPLLPPGTYSLKYTLSDGSTRLREVNVLLQQVAVVDLVVDYSSDASTLEEVMVVGTSSLVADTGGASLSASVSNEIFDALPVGQEYRDLIKLVPGVQYTEDGTRGPSAGGSGQDNAYQFDGVDVTLPLFGTLSAEPSTHDIDQVSIIRGGAKAIGFNRSGGFTVNTISKSGTDEFHGEASYQLQSAGMTGDLDSASVSRYKEDKDWITASLSGPIWKDKLYFYGSYYRPTVTRDNRSNAYGPVPNYKSVRDEYFAKFTFAITDNLLLDASYRTSERTGENLSVGSYEAASASEGEKATLDIGIVEASWIINDVSSAYVKYTDFQNDNTSQPDTLFNFPIAIGDSLDINNLDQQGYFSVPNYRAGEDAYNAFVAPLINQYGYSEGGVQTGGGAVGGAPTINEQNFSRESIEFGWDYSIMTPNVTHDLHMGVHQETISEELIRSSNGWGQISVPGGRVNSPEGVPIYYQTLFSQMSIADSSGGALIPPIVSETKSRNVEVNDTISWKNWQFNIGFLFSQDRLYGQGLKKNKDNVSGFEQALGHRYLMKDIKMSDMIQPRLGVNLDINDQWSAFANYARYNPSASSLARAASWARNLATDIRAYYDENGNFISIDPVKSSSGKMFQKGIEPRYIDEFLLGAVYQVNNQLTTRAHVRYRKGRNFWEDTNNNARVDFSPPPGIPRELYVPNLSEIRAEIGGSSYVVAQLDNAHTDYYELNLEAEWVGDRFYVQGSYVYSEYTGNFDQDNSTTNNDQNIFIGSSNIGDGVGRQLWDFKKGTLRGDRPHQFKIYGFYDLGWNAGIGAYFVYQSGQPWETWDVEYYRDQLTATGSSSTSSTNRYSEPAGSRRSSSHNQLDLNYTQNFYFGAAQRYNLQFRADLFNVFDNQTGYDINPFLSSSTYGEPRSYFNPRRLQLMAKFLF